MTPILVGFLAALGVALFGWWTGFDRDRSFYPTVVIVVASFYELFGAMGGSVTALWAESGVMALFVILAVVAFRVSPWFAVVGLVGHGVFDSFHAAMIANPGVPVWWPQFCGTYDVAAGAFLALQLSTRRTVRNRRTGAQ